MNPVMLSALTCASGTTFLLLGYEMIRSPALSLFKQHYGAEGLPWVMMTLPLFITLALYIYGKLLTRFGGEKTCLLSCGLSAGLISVCYGLLQVGAHWATIPLFIIGEIYIVLLVEQCWSFVNSIFTTDMGKRFNGYVLATSSLGGIIGGLLVHHLAQVVGTTHLLLINIATFLPAAGLFAMAFYTARHLDKRTGRPKDSPGGHEGPSAKETADHLGWISLLANRSLFPVLAVITASQAYSTIIGLHFQTSLQESIPTVDEQTAFSGLVFAIVSSSAVFFQLCLVKLSLRVWSPLAIQGMIPLVHIAALVITLLVPGIYSASLAFIVFKSIDYSFFRASKEIFYIPLNFDARYRAKEFIDVMGYRTSKGLASAGLSFYQQFVAGLTTTGLSYGGLIMAVLWGLSLTPYRRAAFREPL